MPWKEGACSLSHCSADDGMMVERLLLLLLLLRLLMHLHLLVMRMRVQALQ